MRYMISFLCMAVAICMWLHLDIFADNQTIFGTIFFSLGYLFIKCEGDKK